MLNWNLQINYFFATESWRESPTDYDFFLDLFIKFNGYINS